MYPPTPVDHRQKPKESSLVTIVPFSVSFCVNRILSASTFVTRALVKTSTWSLANRAYTKPPSMYAPIIKNAHYINTSAYFDSASSYVLRICSRDWIKCTDTSFLRILGYCNGRQPIEASASSSSTAT